MHSTDHVIRVLRLEVCPNNRGCGHATCELKRSAAEHVERGQKLDAACREAWDLLGELEPTEAITAWKERFLEIWEEEPHETIGPDIPFAERMGWTCICGRAIPGTPGAFMADPEYPEQDIALCTEECSRRGEARAEPPLPEPEPDEDTMLMTCGHAGVYWSSAWKCCFACKPPTFPEG